MALRNVHAFTDSSVLILTMGELTFSWGWTQIIDLKWQLAGIHQYGQTLCHFFQIILYEINFHQRLKEYLKKERNSTLGYIIDYLVRQDVDTKGYMYSN